MSGYSDEELDEMEQATRDDLEDELWREDNSEEEED